MGLLWSPVEDRSTDLYSKLSAQSSTDNLQLGEGEEMGIFPVPNAVNGVPGFLFL